MMKGEKPPVTDINMESKWRGMLAWPVLAIHMYGYIGSLLMIQQYAYYAIQTGKFPGLNHTSSQHSVCEVNTTSDGYQIQLEIQKDTSTLILYMNLAAGIPAIFVNFMISCYSDRYGRKKLLIFTIVIQCVRAVLEALAVYFRWNINVFIAFSLINGLAGGQMGPMTICFSMAADMTSTGKSRSFGIALIDVAIGTGIIFGSLTSGYMIKNIGYSSSFAIIAGFYLLDVCISLFLMETRQPEKDKEIVPLKQNIQDAFRFYIDRQFAKNGTRSIYILCTAIFLTSLVADIGRSNVDVLYELNSPFCWQSVRIGIYGTFMTIAKFWVGIPSIRIFQKCMNDENIIFIGLVSNILCLVLSGLSPNSIALYFVPVIGFASMIPIPLTRGIMSRLTSPSKQGALFAGTGAVSAICNVLGSVVGNGIYTGTVGIHRGFAFFLLAGSCMVGICLLVALKVNQNRVTTEKDFRQTVNVVDTEIAANYSKPVVNEQKLSNGIRL